ncbi:MAG: cupin domain-containing protein [Ruminococcus sp.]|nr:cupin domain-containing protein [Ruminococcus sp.]
MRVPENNEKTRTIPELIIEKLDLVPLEGEGGMYRCTYEGNQMENRRKEYSAIYYMLTGDMFSHMHRLEDDELYHYYMGDALELLLLYPDGTFQIKYLGSDLINGQTPQILVPGGVWQGSRVINGGEFCLCGTTMTPGYIQEEYEQGDCRRLCDEYPEASNYIKRLCTGRIMDERETKIQLGGGFGSGSRFGYYGHQY